MEIVKSILKNSLIGMAVVLFIVGGRVLLNPDESIYKLLESVENETMLERLIALILVGFIMGIYFSLYDYFYKRSNYRKDLILQLNEFSIGKVAISKLSLLNGVYKSIYDNIYPRIIVLKW